MLCRQKMLASNLSALSATPLADDQLIFLIN